MQYTIYDKIMIMFYFLLSAYFILWKEMYISGLLCNLIALVIMVFIVLYNNARTNENIIDTLTIIKHNLYKRGK